MSHNSTPWADSCIAFPETVVLIYSVCGIRVVLLLPPSLAILCVAQRRWWRSAGASSHCDVFTYHCVAMEMLYMLGVVMFAWSLAAANAGLSLAGSYLSTMTLPGQVVLNLLTCVERYLAVIHPITYRGLRGSGGARIRNVSIGWAWLVSLSWIGITAAHLPGLPFTEYICLLLVSFAVTSFCSASVLRVLVRPGPGEVGGDTERADRSKRRAFSTMACITGVLLVYFMWLVVGLALNHLEVLNMRHRCLALLLSNLWAVPTSLIMPLNFLHRAGKLSCRR